MHAMNRLLPFAGAFVLAAACQCSRPRGLLELEPPAIDFGQVAPRTQKVAIAMLVNRGQVGANAASVSMDPGFGDFGAFEVMPRGPLQLGPGERVELTVVYAPPAPGRHSARVRVSSDGEPEEVFALLTGEAGAGGGAGGGGGGAGGGGGGDCLDGTACDDGNPCTADDRCAGGRCAGTLRDAGASCDDGDACTAADACSPSGACSGQVRTCNTPPASFCLDSRTQRSYSAAGTCSSDAGCSYAHSDTTCPTGCDAATGRCNSCTPKTCAQLGANCGQVSDGCGGTLNCGTCPAGQTCGGGGRANVCGIACGSPCSNWTECTQPGEGCDVVRGCCVPCGASGAPCCVNFAAGRFYCGDGGTALVCGRSYGSGTTTGYYCCQNQGDGCCQQGRCTSTGTCCKCPANGLNFCVQPSFGCGGC